MQGSYQKNKEIKDLGFVNRFIFDEKSLPGFTLIELLVAISIMAILLSMVSFNFGGFRIDRNLSIAQNELITNLRKAQSYTLSSRLVSGNQSGQFFIITINTSTPYTYKLQAMYGITATPTPPTLVDNVETYQLPLGVQFAATNPVVITRSTIPTTQSGPCTLIAFKAPYAKIYFNTAVSGGFTNGCYKNDLISDDYGFLLNFVANTANYTTSADSYAVIKLTDNTGTKVKKVLIRGVTGVICSTQDGISCSN